jgi:DNA-binding NarL/FixJ family response regulator
MNRPSSEKKQPITSGTETKVKPAATERIRVLVVDDHVVMRQGLIMLLLREPDMEIAGEASDGEASVRLVRELCPDVVLMDVGLPGMNGIEATRIIHSELPGIRIIGLSMFQEREQGAMMRKAGAVDYLTKSDPAENLIARIRGSMHRGSLPAQQPL